MNWKSEKSGDFLSLTLQSNITKKKKKNDAKNSQGVLTTRTMTTTIIIRNKIADVDDVVTETKRLIA